MRACVASLAQRRTLASGLARSRCTASAVPHAPAPSIATLSMLPSTADTARAAAVASLQTPDLTDADESRLTIAMTDSCPSRNARRLTRFHQLEQDVLLG